MSDLPKKLKQRIESRINANALRELKTYRHKHDFSSNDYLGIVKAGLEFAVADTKVDSGATGSRLLSGNHQGYTEFENTLRSFHKVEAALVFNSGYDANVGLLSAIGLRGDLILFDALAHASIRDGIQLAKAKALKFRHNDLEHLEQLLQKNATEFDQCYIVTESVFSMDGDSPDLPALSNLCKQYGAKLIVDEAHALGVFGDRGEGLVQQLAVEKEVFARIVTFGKALGYHGAAVLCSAALKTYLVNFARALIYTTALPINHLEQLNKRYLWMRDSSEYLQLGQNVHRNIALLRLYVNKLDLKTVFIESGSAIHCCLVPGNSQARAVASSLQEAGYGVLPILAPTVAEGEERLRICLHAFNAEEEISDMLKLLASFLKS